MPHHTRGTHMKKLIFLITLLAAIAAAPNDYQTYESKKDGYGVTYPKGWEKEDTQPDYSVIFTNAAKDAKIFVKLVTLTQKANLPQFMAEVEKSLEKENLVKPEKRKLGAALIKAANADDGLLSAFMMGDEELPIRQVYYLFSKGNKIYALVFTFVEENKEQYRKIMEDMLLGFKIK
jgi:hypothetical protein